MAAQNMNGIAILALKGVVVLVDDNPKIAKFRRCCLGRLHPVELTAAPT